MRLPFRPAVHRGSLGKTEATGNVGGGSAEHGRGDRRSVQPQRQRDRFRSKRWLRCRRLFDLKYFFTIKYTLGPNDTNIPALNHIYILSGHSIVKLVPTDNKMYLLARCSLMAFVQDVASVCT